MSSLRLEFGMGKEVFAVRGLGICVFELGLGFFRIVLKGKGREIHACLITYAESLGSERELLTLSRDRAGLAVVPSPSNGKVEAQSARWRQSSQLSKKKIAVVLSIHAAMTIICARRRDERRI